jgi:hypothetical protein
MKTKKYTQDYDAIAYRAIALGGTDKAAWESLGVIEKTFYNWMGKHTSFRVAVEAAREFHQACAPDALRLALLSHIVETLKNKGEVITTQTRTVQRTVQRDGRNQVIFVAEVETSTEVSEVRGIPRWIADKVMANAPALGEAIAKVIGAGYDVAEPGDSEYLLPPVNANRN